MLFVYIWCIYRLNWQLLLICEVNGTYRRLLAIFYYLYLVFSKNISSFFKKLKWLWSSRLDPRSEAQVRAGWDLEGGPKGWAKPGLRKSVDLWQNLTRPNPWTGLLATPSQNIDLKPSKLHIFLSLSMFQQLLSIDWPPSRHCFKEVTITCSINPSTSLEICNNISYKRTSWWWNWSCLCQTQVDPRNAQIIVRHIGGCIQRTKSIPIESNRYPKSRPKSYNKGSWNGF